MRLRILSDLHLEFAPFAAPAADADLVILAGDISTGLNGFKWAQTNFPECPVLYVLGNHEFYGQKLQKLTEQLKEMAKGTNIQILDNDVFSLGDVTFLGATLWTDFALNGDPVASEVVAQTGMNDYRRIRTLPRYSRLKPSETRRFHMESRRWLEDQVFSRNGEKIVIVTHHAPSRQSIPPGFQENAFNPSFASDMNPFITESNVKLWIHGHIHSHSDYAVGNTRILANPRGYPGESKTGFDPLLVVGV